MSEELPEGWAPVRVDDLLAPGGLFDGPFGSNLKSADYTESGARVVRLENLANLRFIPEKKTYISLEKYAGLKKHTIAEGDILVGSFIEDAVRVCLLPSLDTPTIAKADCFCIRPVASGVDNKFLAYRLGSLHTRDALVAEIHGATRSRITTKQLRDLEVVLCPLNEQRRIVAKVEALLAEVIATRARLAKVSLILKRFRQAVLMAAFAGTLTQDWRETSPALETADELILRIGKERDERYLAACRAARKATKKALPEYDNMSPALRKDLEFPAIPEQWSWVDLRFLMHEDETFCYGVVQPGEDIADGVPLIRAGDLHDIERSIPGLRRIPAAVDAEYARARVRGGEILVTVVGANIGTVAIAPTACQGFNIARAVAKVPIRDFSATYVYHWLSAPDAVRWMAGDAREVARPTLNLEQLRTLPVPLPPLAEQHEIVRRVSALFALADSIERRLAVAIARTDKLPQAILAKAFRGELVPTEAELARAEGRDYEPASALLERIRTEREAAGPTAARGRKKAAPAKAPAKEKRSAAP